MKYVWLDVDPGHDDATAIMLALNLPNIKLLGISTTHGNASSEFTALNAARCAFAFGGNPSDVRVYPGADRPLILEAKHDPEIHGVDGLGGVEGLPSIDDQRVLDFFDLDVDGQRIRALEAMPKIIKETWKGGSGNKVTVVSSGPMTNIALFVSVYPDLLEAVEEFLFMGGGVGLGNRSAVAEFNILCDPHATQIVLNAPVKTTMIPINVTHTAIVTRKLHYRLLAGKEPGVGPEDAELELPVASTNLRHTLSTLISFFAASYKSTFGFNNGPPLHDALTIAYLSNPELFNLTRYRVDVELAGCHTTGETVVDIWDYKQSDSTWGRTGKNCQVADSLNVQGFFDLLLEAVERCDQVSPLNSR
ncbi:uridine nucleosidase [Coprinopsis marcescibilis]|uniref:Uridine nucleosidase n=1 Tax=Coprinopsis marcescibilis TaxID=230819 RepID=A0A5C3KZA0_COPMA|nr:uridine nucleosidase [Coprinopsis marcescibilis]